MNVLVEMPGTSWRTREGRFKGLAPRNAAVKERIKDVAHIVAMREAALLAKANSAAYFQQAQPGRGIT
ncbi:hypothetical protein B5P43_07390 [Bacillus sp. SRB_336]|nr:hypothetical protein B5P43_07390 [Bacillus sp. SRB_336]